MKPPVENIKVSQRARDILIKLKRKTDIEHWNVLCRWAFCASLSNPTKPVPLTSSPDSNIDMTWKVFAGLLSECLPAMLVLRAIQDGMTTDKDGLAAYFRNHLERGISYMQNVDGLDDLFDLEKTEKKGRPRF
ncbi:MAG: DNA sulfur modification protein DndE [bacterium]